MAPNPEKVYEGKPCKKCGNTLRFKRNRHLVCRNTCNEKEKERVKRYNHSEKGRQQRERYRQTEKGKISNRKSSKKWHEQRYWGDGFDSILLREKMRSRDRLRTLKKSLEGEQNARI